MVDSSADGATGVHVTLAELVRLQYRTRGVSFLPRQPVHSLLSGRHASRMRGRGLDFEELRAYLPGDDVRTIDWRVTARTQKTHVRVYTEERDRPAILIVDQRVSMFFGSTLNMKSVTAARLAAIGAWRVLDQGDRVGGVIFSDDEVREVRPHRSNRTVVQFLHHLVDRNQALRADTGTRSNPRALNEVLGTVARTAAHDALIVIISDFDGADSETDRWVTRMARHNDVLAVPIYDPMATRSPPARRLVVSDGELQIEVRGEKADVRRRFREFADERIAAVMDWQRKLGVPVLPVSTDTDELDQLRELLGAGPAARRR